MSFEYCTKDLGHSELLPLYIPRILNLTYALINLDKSLYLRMM